MLSLGELSCSACCRLEHISTSLPITRPHVRSHNSCTTKPAPGQVTSESSETAVIQVQKGIFLLKGWGLVFSSTTAGLHGSPREISPRISDFPSREDQEWETGSSSFVSWGWVGDEPGITFSLCRGAAEGAAASAHLREDLLAGTQRVSKGAQGCSLAPHHPSQSSASHSRGGFLPPAPQSRPIGKGWHHSHTVMQGQSGFLQTARTQPGPGTKGQSSPHPHQCCNVPPSFHTLAKPQLCSSPCILP